MVTNTKSSPLYVVADASFLVALCAKEMLKYMAALKQLQFYLQNGYVFYGPGGLAMETLFALCRRLNDGLLTVTEHQQSIAVLEQFLK